MTVIEMFERIIEETRELEGYMDFLREELEKSGPEYVDDYLKDLEMAQEDYSKLKELGTNILEQVFGLEEDNG